MLENFKYYALIKTSIFMSKTMLHKTDMNFFLMLLADFTFLWIENSFFFFDPTTGVEEPMNFLYSILCGLNCLLYVAIMLTEKFDN